MQAKETLWSIVPNRLVCVCVRVCVCVYVCVFRRCQLTKFETASVHAASTCPTFQNLNLNPQPQPSNPYPKPSNLHLHSLSLSLQWHTWGGCNGCGNWGGCSHRCARWRCAYCRAWPIHSPSKSERGTIPSRPSPTGAGTDTHHVVGAGTDTDTEWWSAQQPHSDRQQRGRVASAEARRLIVHASLPAVSAYPFEIAP